MYTMVESLSHSLSIDMYVVFIIRIMFARRRGRRQSGRNTRELKTLYDITSTMSYKAINTQLRFRPTISKTTKQSQNDKQ